MKYQYRLEQLSTTLYKLCILKIFCVIEHIDARVIILLHPFSYDGLSYVIPFIYRNFYKYTFRLQENPFLSNKVHLILDRIGYLFYDIMH